MRPFRLSRRTVLRGLGAAVALPLLDAMLDDRGRLVGEAGAQGIPPVPPVPLVTWFFAHGTKMDAWTPTTEGPDYAPTPCLEPLAAYHADVLVLSGLANAMPSLLTSVGGPHSRGGASFATAMPTSYTGATGPTFERLAASQLGGATRIRALAVVAQDGNNGSIESGSSAMLNNLSWDGPSRPAAAERDPGQLFARLFGGGSAGAARGGVLDQVRGAFSRLQSRVGRADRARLEQHLDAIRDLEREVNTPSPACPGAAAPLVAASSRERARQMMSLLAAALRCDLTRYASFALTNALDNEPLPWLGLSTGHHDLTHADDHDTIVRITRYQMEQLAFFLGELKALPGPTGTILDRSLVFASSEVSDGSTHEYRNLPVLLAGRGGGLRPGTHLRVPVATPISALYLSLLQRAGVNAARFGYDGETALALPSV